MKFFVDTSAWYALYDRDDRNHEAVARFWHEIGGKASTLYTSDYVFDETVTLLRTRVGHAVALAFGERLRESRVVSLIEVQAAEREDAWTLFKRYDDQCFSFTDCTSFVLMRRLGLTDVLAFDADFRSMGFRLLPA